MCYQNFKLKLLQEQPCSEGCAPTYGFQHQMSLTSNTQKFAKEVDKARISGNLDAPEGGFDAIMQVAMFSKAGNCGK